MSLGGSNASVSRIIERTGYEDVDEGGKSPIVRMHAALENAPIGALRREKMIRERRPAWSSRARMLSLHAPQGSPAMFDETA